LCADAHSLVTWLCCSHVGNLGPEKQGLSIDKENLCTWLSRDGGLTWTDVVDDLYIYEYLDHGNIIVMAKFRCATRRNEAAQAQHSTNEQDTKPPTAALNHLSRGPGRVCCTFIILFLHICFRFLVRLRFALRSLASCSACAVAPTLHIMNSNNRAGRKGILPNLPYSNVSELLGLLIHK
jgi:hypothetical protein